MIAKVQWTYGGRLKHDYTGAFISYRDRQGTQHLGNVTGSYRDEDDVLWFTVRHFNGEPAPDTMPNRVTLLERDELTA